MNYWLFALIFISSCLSLPAGSVPQPEKTNNAAEISRGGAADISLTQSWVAPGTTEEVGLTTLSFSYAITQNLRLSTDIQKQNSRQSKDSRVGIVLEWMP